MTPQSVVLDPQLFSTDLEEIMTKLRARTVGQDHAVEAFGRIFETFLAGYSDPERPIGVVLELGPTGVGKTMIVENLVSPSCQLKTPSRTRGRAGSIFNPRGCFGCRFPTRSDARSWLPHSLVQKPKSLTFRRKCQSAEIASRVGNFVFSDFDLVVTHHLRVL